MTQNSPFCFMLMLYCYPIRSVPGSGVMFDALAHGLPFISSDLEFFREFSSMGLGIAVKRTPGEFTKALLNLDGNYSAYLKEVESFKAKLKWDYVANMHIQLLYENIMYNNSLKSVTKGTVSCRKIAYLMDLLEQKRTRLCPPSCIGHKNI